MRTQHPQQRLDFRAIDQQQQTTTVAALQAVHDLLLGVLTQYEPNLHSDDRAALHLAIRSLGYLLQPPTQETIVTQKEPFRPGGIDS